MTTFNGSVHGVGTDHDGSILVHVLPNNSTVFTGGARYFKARDIHKKEIFATALTAISANLDVTIFVEPDVSEFSEIRRLYVIR